MYGERRSGGFRGGNSGGGMSTPPVRVGDELEVTIEAVGEKGDGLAKKNGFVLFVPGVKEGQLVKIRVTKVLRKVGFAEVIGQGAPAGEAAPAAEGESSEAPAEEAPAEEAPAQEAPAESSEDSDSFGEEAPAEESSEESSDEQ